MAKQEKQWTAEQKAAAAKDKPAEAKADATPKAPRKMQIDKERRATYTKADAKTPSKGRVIDNADAIAVELRKHAHEGTDAFIAIARENGEEITAKAEKYVASKLNPGQIRMNIGNALRGKYNKGEVVVIKGVRLQDKQALADRQAKEKAAKEAAVAKKAEAQAKPKQ